MRRTFLVLLSLASMLVISPVRLHAWELSESGLHPVHLPADFQPLAAQEQGDLDGDGSPEQLLLADGMLQIRSLGTTHWTSPDSWEVRQVLIADLNRDAQPEAVLLVSRPFRPWPVDAWLPNGGRIKDFHDSQGLSCHIILIGWDGVKFRERWAGSALAEPVTSMAAASLGTRSDRYLVTLEKQYDDAPSAPARHMKVWNWNGFGFSLVFSLDGPFTGLVVSRAGDRQILILEQ